MLALPHTNSWGFIYTNAANGSATPGTSIVPGASDVEGSFTEFAPDASITTDIHYIIFNVNGGTTNGQSKCHFLDIAWDPAGGTSYTEFLFQNLAVGASGALNSQIGRVFHAPCKIPAGSAIAARVQGNNATAGTVFLEAKLYGKPSRPELWRNAAYSETLGNTSGTLGTNVTPGNAAFSAWVSLGTTTKKHFWAQLGLQIDSGTLNTRSTRWQLGVGGGAAGDTHVIIDTYNAATSAEIIASPLQQPCTWEIPAGAEIWVRGNGNAAGDTWNANAVLFGG